jgi:Holliday junction resolvase RusA-like endonuclease
MIVIELAGQPVGKGRPRFVRATGHAYTPGKTRSYEQHLGFAGQQAMVGKPLLEGALAVHVEACFIVPKSWSRAKQAEALLGLVRPTVAPDADNLIKTLDALNGVVWLDDKQIVEASIRKIYGAKPYFRLEVRPALRGGNADDYAG